MASRGSHQTTSDGADYNSREKVATHYAASAAGGGRGWKEKIVLFGSEGRLKKKNVD